MFKSFNLRVQLWRGGGGGGEEEEDLFVFKDTIEGPRAPAVEYNLKKFRVQPWRDASGASKENY